MLLAEGAAATPSTFDPFDVFILVFTLIILIGVIRLLTSKEKNVFAIAFGTVSLLVFLFMDVVMVQHWMS